MKDVQQKTLTAGTEETSTVQLKRSQFLVKNSTEDSIMVKPWNNTAGSVRSVIGAGSWERVFSNSTTLKMLQEKEQKQQTAKAKRNNASCEM